MRLYIAGRLATFSADRMTRWSRVSNSSANGRTVSNVCLQCQELPGSQNSSPLSLMEPYAGRSMDPLLPAADSGRKTAAESDYDLAQRYQSGRQKPQVKA